MLAVERAAAALDETWHHLMTQRRASRRGTPPAAAAAAWRLHHRMSHFVRQVHVYLKDDVVRRTFADACATIEAADTFEEVQRAHRVLLDRLTAQTFLAHPAVCEKLQAVLQQCGLLCRSAPWLINARQSCLCPRIHAMPALIHVSCGDSADWCARLCSTVTGGPEAPLSDIESRFTSNAAIFCDLLHSHALQGQAKGLAVIRQLLLRLSFNDCAPSSLTPL